ncbi:MAG: hypothetical protein RSB58_03250 [Clostridium sp.]
MPYILLEAAKESSFIDKLSNLITKIFNQILSPILSDILTIIINLIGNVIWNALAKLFLTLLIVLCNIVDFVAGIFDIFSGTANIKYNGQPMPLINAFFQFDAVRVAFLVVTLMAIAVCFLFTIYGTAKSMSDMTLQDERPISKVLKNAMKSCVMFMLVPFLCIFLLHLSSAVTAQAEAALRIGGKDTTVGTIIFLTGSLPAGRDEFHSDTPSLDQGIWAKYLNDPHTYSYNNRKQVDIHFDATKFDYVTSIVCCVVLFFMLLGAIMLFIGRLFELLLLYLVSPMFVSSIGLDDGAMFKKWRELFIAKFFSGFGCIFSMKFYLMVVPVFVGGSINFGSGSGELDCVLKVFFIIGGAWAVFKGQHLMLQILNPQAAEMAQQSSILATAVAMSGPGRLMALAKMAGGKGGKGKGMLPGGKDKGGDKGGGPLASQGGGSKGDSGGQAFTGKKG